MPVVSRMSSTICVLGGMSLCGAAALPSLSYQFRSADTVVVGAMVSARRLPRSSVLSKTSPREAIEYHSPYACEISIHVDILLKASMSLAKAGSELPVVWYPPFDDCQPKSTGREFFNRDALWLLRTENGTLRTFVDNHTTVWPMGGFSPQIQRELTKRDASAALTYLAVKPGQLVPEQRYPMSLIPVDVIPLLGINEYLKLFGSVYKESTEEQRGLISLNLATLGYCLGAARRFAQSDSRFRGWVELVQFLNRDMDQKIEATQLQEMQWPDKDAVLKAYGDEKGATDGLIQLSCRSDTAVRTRARELLTIYFAIEPSTIHCVPCE